MKLLMELVGVIDSYKAQKIQVLQNPFTTNNKYSAFYKGIKEGDIRTDDDASKLLYNSSPEDHKYKKLKYRFRQRLLNSILFIDVNKPNYTDVQKAYYNSYKDWATVRILLGKGAKESAIAIAEKTLRHALKFEFTELSCNIARVLRLYFATSIGSRKKYEEYNAIYKEQSKILEAESLAEELYSELLIDFVTSKAIKRENIKKAASYSKLLRPYLDDIQSYNFLFFAYSIIVIRYEIANDYKKVIYYSHNAYELLRKKEFSLKVQIFPFVFKVFFSYVKMGKYNHAASFIEPCVLVLDEGAVNWFKFNQVHFIYLMHVQKYEEAGALVQQVLGHRRIKYQSGYTQEVWKIYEAYAYCMSNWEKEGEGGGFRLGKFMNEVPVFSKDKRGLNISILIVQILILLQNKKHSKIIDLIDSLERYSSRYLRKNETYRSNCFIKMLITLSRGSFSLIAVKRHSEKYVNKLKEVPLSEADQPLEIEIVPFERLWEFVLAALR